MTHLNYVEEEMLVSYIFLTYFKDCFRAVLVASFHIPFLCKILAFFLLLKRRNQVCCQKFELWVTLILNHQNPTA